MSGDPGQHSWLFYLAVVALILSIGLLNLLLIIAGVPGSMGRYQEDLSTELDLLLIVAAVS